MDRDCIVQIIENAKETDHVDFKREFYKSLSESDLPKDIAAFANTALTEDKYIIFGVEDESRQVIGIDAHTLPSQDSLDEYLASTIEPFVHAEIDTIDYQESIVIGYIKVFAKNTDRPYMIKKNCGKNNSIHRGDIYIRKGTVIQKAFRADLDEMYKTNGTLLLRFCDDLIRIEPIQIRNSIIKNLTYGQFDLEIYNDTPRNFLLDEGIITISTDVYEVSRRVVSILPNIGLNNNPLTVPSGSREVHTCLFEFTSQDCVDFEFDTEGWMKNDANIRVVLFDTDGNEYSSGIKRVMLKAKGEILHKVKIKYKNEVVGVTKRRFF